MVYIIIGKFLTHEEFQRKYRLQVSFLRYFQILSSIPVSLKGLRIRAYDVFHRLSDDQSIMRCKDYYNFTPTAVKTCPQALLPLYSYLFSVQLDSCFFGGNWLGTIIV